SIAHQEYEQDAYSGLGYVSRMLNNLEAAFSYHQHALDIAQQRNDKASEQQQFGMIGLVLFEAKQYGQALSCYQQAIAIAEVISDEWNIGLHLVNVANVYNALGEIEHAIEFLEKSLEIATKYERRRQ